MRYLRQEGIKNAPPRIARGSKDEVGGPKTPYRERVYSEVTGRVSPSGLSGVPHQNTPGPAAGASRRQVLVTLSGYWMMWTLVPTGIIPKSSLDSAIRMRMHP
jgi:hypothetical protein